MARIWGGCHDRGPARSPAVLLLSRIRYRDCDRDRNPDHLMRVRPGGSAAKCCRALSLDIDASGSADRTERSVSWSIIGSH
jgi:hypothetical protein